MFTLPKSVVSAIALAATVTLAGPAHSQSQGRATEGTASRPGQTAVLLNLLRAPHPEVTGQQLRRMGPEVESILIEFASAEAHGSTTEPQVRLRAMAWLQHFPSRATKAVLLEVFHAAQSGRGSGASIGDIAGRRVAVRAMALAFGVEALPTLRAALQSPNLYLREAAAYGLGDVDDRRVRAMLVDHLARETEITVRDAASASLQLCDKRDRDRR